MEPYLSYLGWLLFITALVVAPTRLGTKMFATEGEEEQHWAFKIFLMLILFPLMAFCIRIFGFILLWAGRIMLIPVTDIWTFFF